METIFEQLGSLTRVENRADEFYNVMENDPFAKELLDIHPQKLNSSRKALYKFMASWFGGPNLFGDPYVNAK